jgi:hypothetical protein
MAVRLNLFDVAMTGAGEKSALVIVLTRRAILGDIAVHGFEWLFRARAIPEA